MKKILILYDNRGYVAYSLLPDAKGKLNITLLKKTFEKAGYVVETIGLHQIRFPTVYNDWYVIYPSSEDYGLFYKSFIEDILLRLQMDGAILLPRFEYFRAHHNKVMMELIRTRMSEEYRTLSAKVFYSIQDLKELLKNPITYPVVVKSAAGAGSAGVALAYNEPQLLRVVEKMGKVKFNGACLTKKDQIRHYLGRIKRKILKNKYILEQPIPREKMILQSFVPGLENDYKVLIFGEKFYLLRRKVRKNDFRASGSGKLEFPQELGTREIDVLNYAEGAYRQLNSPLLSIDIAHDGSKCHMVEFQCLNFGPYTLQFSSCYYMKKDNNWITIETKSVLEEEFANSVITFLEKQGVYE